MASQSQMPTSPPFRVRRARLSEAGALARLRLLMSQELQHLAGVRPAEPARRNFRGLERWIREKMRGRRLAGFLAEDTRGNTVAGGFVWLQEVSPRPDRPGRYLPRIQGMYTFPEWRKKGAGSAILDASLRWARARGFERVMLRASTVGENLYASKGFVRVAEMQRELGRPRPKPRRPRRQ
jgi:GNAT superfamily N-acetyltransferase